MAEPFSILNVSGPFREPREPAFSYDYSIQRPTWPTPHAVRVKIGIPNELDPIKQRLLGAVQGTAGQQVVLNTTLTRRIADFKLRLANEEGLLGGARMRWWRNSAGRWRISTQSWRPGPRNKRKR